MKIKITLLLIATTTIVLSACIPSVNIDSTNTYSGSILNNPVGYQKALRFIGSPATANPLAADAIPAHPYLAAQGRNGMHSDSYATDTYANPGPLGNNLSIHTMSFGTLGGECATATFDSVGRLITVCSDFTQMRLLLLDPDSLQIIAQHTLPLRASNQTLDLDTIMNDTSGGAYFHLMTGDKPLIANAENHIQIFSFNGSDWVVQKDYDLTTVLATGALVTDAIPDWDGNIWFVTRQGVVGVIDKNTEVINIVELADPEEIQNSLAVAQDGVYIVSDYALYRFEMNISSQPVYTWRETYDRGTQKKPGAISQGSGTTPTLLDDNGDQLVAITDNADGQMHVEVFHREDSHVGTRKICSVPVFRNNYSMTENSLIGYGRSLVAENNFGYISPLSPTWTEPGVARIDVRTNLTGCDVVWQSNEASQTVVAKLSLATGLIYLYTRENAEKTSNFGFSIDSGFNIGNVNVGSSSGIDTHVVEAEAWYLTAIDFATGATRFKVFTGTGNKFNNNWAPITLGSDGSAYVGVLNGMIVVKDN